MVKGLYASFTDVISATQKIGKSEFNVKRSLDDYLKDASDALTDGEFQSSTTKFNLTKGIFGIVAQQLGEIYYTTQSDINNAMWKYSDQDENGYIDMDEYNRVLNSIIQGEKDSPINSAEDILSGIINNNNEEYNQIKNYLIEQDKGIDTNKDNQYSRDEFNNSVVNHILTDKDE